MGIHEWMSTAARHPAHGQTVLAKMNAETEERSVTFLAEPYPRWQGRDFTSRVESFPYWRPIPSAA